MNKRNQLLVAILLAQVALVAYLYWPQGRPSTGTATRLFPGVSAGDVNTFSIADQDEKNITLIKESGVWLIPAADNFPADREKLDRFLEKITTLNSGRLVTRTKSSHKRLKVDSSEFNRRVDFKSGPENEGNTVYMGSSSSYKTVYLRVEGQNEVYLIKDLQPWEMGVEPSGWWETKYFSINADEVVKIRLKNKEGDFSLEKQGENEWSMEGRPSRVATEAIQGFLGRLNPIPMTESLSREAKKEYKMDTPMAQLTINTPDQEITLAIGAEQKDANSYVLKSSASPFYVRAAKASLTDILEKKADDFLAREEPLPEENKDAAEGTDGQGKTGSSPEQSEKGNQPR